MSSSQSSNSKSLELNALKSPLAIKGYHFTSATTPTLTHGENCDVVKGFRITNKSPVVAKISTDSLRFEREFYIMKKLYQYKDGSLFIVRPLEYINMPSGMTVVIYADEGTDFLKQTNTDGIGLRSPTRIVSSENALSSTSFYSKDSTTATSISIGGLGGSWTDKQKQQYSGNSKRDMRSSIKYNTMDENDEMPVYDLCTFLRFAIKCCQALAFIHKHNSWHHEINLNALQWDGTDGGPVKLWNFGSGSKSLESYLSSEGWRKTVKSKRLMGMLQSVLVYMSPEQTGRTTYAPDHRSDIYSLGVVFFTIITSKTPFDGEPLEILNGILSKKIPLAHELRVDLPLIISKIIEKMTNKSPDDRYTSIHGVCVDFEECLNRLMTSGDPSSTHDQCIPAFPLAQHDIASVFILPKTIYGRQTIISEMISIIERCSEVYQTMHIRNNSNTRSRSKIHQSDFGISAAMREVLSNEVASDELMTNDSDLSHQSSTYSSRSSSYDMEEESEISSNISGRLAASSSIKTTATLVGVYGPGGIGKSTLFTAVKATARQNGYVATCKFDSRNKVPYSAVLRSLSQILQQILSEPDIKAFYAHVKLSLGTQFSNISMITDFVPELKCLLNAEEAKNNSNIQSIQMDNIEVRVRFHNLYVELIRAITRWGMTTLFLDDLHQADEPSLEILDSLATSRTKILMFLSYRDQEMTEKLSELLENQIADVHRIAVDPINSKALTDFICDTLHRSRDTVNREFVLPLVDIIYKKTKGNAFYISQLLRTLERKRYIYFDWETNEWSYSLKEIEDAAIFECGGFHAGAELDVSFIVARLRELPPAGQALLKWASFVGDTFSWDTIKSLMLNADNDTNNHYLEYHPDKATTEGKSNDVNTASNFIDSCTSISGRDSDESDKSALRSLSHQPLYLPSTSVDTDRDSHSNSSSKSSQHSSCNNPISGLQAVLQEGYIMPLSVDQFKWSHDRISQAAVELANPNAHNKMHLAIAQHMMKEPTVDALLAGDHLLKCKNLIMKFDDRKPYRDILILAGDRSRSTGALSMAYAYYMGAIQLANSKQEWSDEEYKTSLKIYCNAAGLSWTVGEYESTERFIQIIFDHARSPMDRLPAYDIQARYYFTMQVHDKARTALLKALDELGDEVSHMDVSEEGLRSLLDETQVLVERHGRDVIINRPPCKDDLLKAMMSIMDELIAVTYFGDQKGEMFYWACRQIILSIKHGPTNTSGTGFVTAGLAYSVLLKKYAFAETVGTIGIDLTDKFGTFQDKGRAHCIYQVFVRQWGHSLQENLAKHTRPGVQFSLSAGDRIYLTVNQVHVTISMFYCGYHVADTLRECEQIYEDVYAWSSTTDMNAFIMSIIRCCKALQGQTYIDTPDVFDGDDGFNDKHYLTESSKGASNPEVSQNWYESYKMIPLTIYGHYDAAIETGNRCIKSMGAHPNHRHLFLNLAYLSLALIQKAKTDPKNKHAYLGQVKEHQEFLYEWATHSPINYAMYWTFLQAELSSLDASDEAYFKAARLYERAITQAREGSWYLELCIFHEYAGAFYNRIGFYNVAYGFIKKAIRLYMAHGSYGKVRHINTKFADLLSELDDDRLERYEKDIQTDPTPFHSQQAWSKFSPSPENINLNDPPRNEPYDDESIPPVTTEKSLMTLDILDMASILKSSQVMSSEVRFENLLTSMINIIFENSGADSIAIIVKDEKFGMYALGKGGVIDSYCPPLPLSQTDKLVSSRIIHHTINTGKSIFIKNVEDDSRFAVGPWFEATGRKAVICMPITHKTTIVGCLLIEGTVGAFTQRHITVLSLLCQQMGISITNAFLFKSIHRVTMANTRMIEAQKRALEESRKSKEAADKATQLREIFLANMSHEIRTPFAGFYGMISLLADTKLDPEQHDLVRTAKDSCEMLLQLIDNLLNFSKLQANKVILDLSPVVIEDLVADVVEMLIAMAVQKKINLSYSLAPDVPSVVIADGNRLRQIIINLLGNAIKFTQQGEVVIRCSVAEQPELVTSCATGDNNRIPLLFEVIDSGIGISKEQKKALFVPFSQVDGSTTRKYGGTGLGLSICLQLVKLMSGNIDVESEPSKGSRFFFTITAEKTDRNYKRFEFMQNQLLSLKNTRVLVADKYPSTVTTIQQLLPGINVDGICSVNDELLQKLATVNRNCYSVVIIGLFLTYDPEFEKWVSKLKNCLQHAHCVIVMHYPRAALSDMLLSNIASNKELLTPSTPSDIYNDDDDYWGERRSQQQPFQPFINIDPISTIMQIAGLDIENNSGNKQNQTVVKMSVPTRRKKLLKLMMEMMERQQGHLQQSQQQQELKPLKLASPVSSVSCTSPLQMQQQHRLVKDTTKVNKLSISVSRSSEDRRLIDSLTPEERELFKSQNILIAEDNMVARKLLYKQLKQLGFNSVVCAINGQEAIDMYTERKPGYFKMAFFDHHMPKCDGVQATKTIRKMEKERNLDVRLPIVTLTADIQDSAKELCMNAGFDQYLTKPMSNTTFAAVLNQFCCDALHETKEKYN